MLPTNQPVFLTGKVDPFVITHMELSSRGGDLNSLMAVLGTVFYPQNNVNKTNLEHSDNNVSYSFQFLYCYEWLTASMCCQFSSSNKLIGGCMIFHP